MKVTSIAEELRVRNVKHNVKLELPRLHVPLQPHGMSAIIVCYGPSLRDTWREIVLPIGQVVTVSGAHDYLVDLGVHPNVHIEFDARAHKAEHITKPGPDTNYYLASCVHPAVFDACKNMPIAMWHAKQGGEHDKVILRREPDAHLIPGGSSVGLRAIEVMYALGYRDFHIHGMDSSFRDGGEEQWAGPHSGKSRFVRDVVDVDCGGRSFKTSIAFWLYAKQFLACRRALNDAKFTLYGDGLLQTAAALKQEIAA